MYIADQGNNRIRKVTILSGKISTIAGTGTGGYSGDGGQATSAMLKFSPGVALDSSGRATFSLISERFLLVHYQATCTSRINIIIVSGW